MLTTARHRLVLLLLAITPGTTMAEPADRGPSYRAFALQHGGDADAGRALFEQDQRLVCTNCHRIVGMEKSGPNLDGIGDKYTRSEIIDHILWPSRQIKPGYEQAIVQLRDGRVLTGRFERATQLEIRLLDASGQQINLRQADVQSVHQSAQSLMPDNLTSLISKSQFADLVAYLQSLRFGVKTGLAAQGQPVEIRHLARPIHCEPIHPDRLRFENPVACLPIPGTANQLVVVEHQQSKIWRLDRDASQPGKHLFLDLSLETHISGNQGLMCVAFHPQFAQNGRYFLEYEVKEDGQVKTVVAERMASADRLSDAGQPSVRLFDVQQPAFNHNGGCIDFGPDGMLYAAFGDGGPQRDPPGYSQNPRVLLGSMVRVDVDQETSPQQPYAIPDDNPFLEAHRQDSDVRPETWAIGFREPWRFSFDPLTGDLWLGDVGQDEYEEVCLVRRGENHGWNVREGFAPFSDEYRRADERYADPVFVYRHGLGFSVTGGYVYRANPQSSFYGVYIFGDFNTRRIWGLRASDDDVPVVRQLGTAPGGIASFGRDQRGEILLVTYEGTIYHVNLADANFNEVSAGDRGFQTTESEPAN